MNVIQEQRKHRGDLDKVCILACTIICPGKRSPNHLEKSGNGWNVYHRSCLESGWVLFCCLLLLFCLLESG